MKRFTITFAAGCSLLSAQAYADEVVKLYCARGARNLSDVEMQLSSQGPHIVKLRFLTEPPKRIADWALRDCLRTAIKLDASRDIATAALVAIEDGSHKEEPRRFSPYGPFEDLTYKASTRTIAVRRRPP